MVRNCSSKTAFKVPFTTAYRVKIDKWLVVNEATIAEGSPLCMLTFYSRLGDMDAAADADVVAPVAGVVHQLAVEDEDVQMGQTIGYIEQIRDSS